MEGLHQNYVSWIFFLFWHELLAIKDGIYVRKLFINFESLVL